jgi:hypothetical protein
MMHTDLEPRGPGPDLESGGYCPECGQALRLNRPSRRGGAGGSRGWACALLGLLLAVSFGQSAGQARQDIEATTRAICGARDIPGRPAAGEAAAGCVRESAAVDYARNEGRFLVQQDEARALNAARDRLAGATRGLAAAALAILLGYIALTRPPEPRPDRDPPLRGLRAWASLERVGLAAAGLVVALGAVALLHLAGSGATGSPDLLARAARAAVDAPFRPVLLATGAAGS